MMESNAESHKKEITAQRDKIKKLGDIVIKHEETLANMRQVWHRCLLLEKTSSYKETSLALGQHFQLSIVKQLETI